MLFEFKSRATGSVVMTQDVGKKVLPLIGKTPDPKGIITVDQMPAAIASLEAACKRETQLAQAAKDKARRGGNEPAAPAGRIPLRPWQRQRISALHRCDNPMRHRFL